ncbi:MAG: hypothetical protein ACE5HL_06005 [Terriglobia bacterium]
MRKALLLMLLAGLALPAAGEITRFWRESSYAEFEKGTPHGVALRSDGEILLAPRYQEVADPNLEFLWAVAADGEGNLYVGGGSPAKVVKIDSTGQSTVVFESKELEVHALLADPATGTLYIATSPDGGVYQLSRDGEAVLLFEPERKYLWDLVRHPDGSLYLATGDKGEIFRITPGGQGEVFYASEETHIRALALDAAGNLYAGTEPNGLVLRISPPGQAFVLYEMPRKEVTALRLDLAGNLYVAAIGQKAKPSAFPPTLPMPVVPPQPAAPRQTPTPTVTVTTGVTPGIALTRRIPFLAAGGSDIYRIAPDGYPERLWTSPRELVYSLSFDAQGRLLAGTGNQGKLLAIDSPNLFTYLAQSSSQQITALVRSHNGRVYLGTANPGKLFALGPELEVKGSFESDVYDAEIFSQWGRLAWQSRSQPAAGSVQLFTRSGNTSDPEKNWSPWSEAYTDPSGTRISSPPARFIQWKAVLHAVDSRTPSLSSISIAYLRRNIAPVVEEVIVQAPGVGIRTMPTAPQQNQPVQLKLPAPSRGSQTQGRTPLPAQQAQAPQRLQPPPQGTAQAGARSVLWSAVDANDDTLAFSVYYRGEGETRWKLMKDNLKEKFYTWDAASLPDGGYYIKVVASDAPSNPAELALSGENISDRFEVDNTPPRIDALAAQLRSRTAEVRFVARDSYSPLKKAEYSLDAADWKTIFPVSRTTDAREHRYVFLLEKLEPGEHTVMVRVWDRFDNPTLAKTTFVVE